MIEWKQFFFFFKWKQRWIQTENVCLNRNILPTLCTEEEQDVKPGTRNINNSDGWRHLYIHTSFISSVHTLRMSFFPEGYVHFEESCSVTCQVKAGHHRGSFWLLALALLLFALLAVSVFSTKVKKQVMMKKQIESHARDRHLTLPRNYSESHLKPPSYHQGGKIFPFEMGVTHKPVASSGRCNSEVSPYLCLLKLQTHREPWC